MAKINVTLLADLVKFTNSKNVTVELGESPTLKDLFNYLIERYGAGLKEFLDFSSSNRAVVFVNSRVALSEDVKLNDGDSVTISPPMEGG